MRLLASHPVVVVVSGPWEGSCVVGWSSRYRRRRRWWVDMRTSAVISYYYDWDSVGHLAWLTSIELRQAKVLVGTVFGYWTRGEENYKCITNFTI